MPAVASPSAALTILEERFCEQFLLDNNATEAYRRASGPNPPKSCKQLGYMLLQRPEVQAKIRALRAEQTKRTGIEGDDILNRFWLIATADPNELVEYRRTACRHCYGRGHKYQMTPRELAERRAQYDESLKRAKEKAGAQAAHLQIAAPEFDELGGIGWDPRKTPAPDCPECFGEGVERIYAKDTRNLSPAARALYAGVKTTKDGLEVKMHSQLDALVNVAKLKGMYLEKIEHSGKVSLEDILAKANETPDPAGKS